MNSNKLSSKKIEKRLIRLRNLERLRENDKETISKLRAENSTLKIRVVELENLVETLLLRIEELEKMIFGGSGGGKAQPPLKYGPEKTTKKKKIRKKSSYKRAVPEQIDKEEVFEITECPDCQFFLEKKKISHQYIEDILLPSVQQQRPKYVLKETIEKGFCPNCKKWHSSRPAQPQQVILGGNVKTLVMFAINILSLSYSQLQNLLLSLYDFEISDGEIANILERCSKKLLPEYQRIKEKIRGKPANHYDETSWQQGKEKDYAWVQTANEGEEAIFVVGKPRGKGVAEDLKGNSKAIGISDCYAAYKNLFESHQICWAHLQRNARDLAKSPSLSKQKQKHCQKFYGKIALIYRRLLDFHRNGFSPEKGGKLKIELLKIVHSIRQMDELDPKKLENLKKRLETYEQALFTCLDHPIPPDNNKAERKLRHLVLKRKKSFGTKTAKGSHAFSINISVTLSHFWTDPKNWFPKIHSFLSA